MGLPQVLVRLHRPNHGKGIKMHCEVCGGMGEVWTGKTDEALERIMETCPECNGSGMEKKCDNELKTR